MRTLKLMRVLPLLLAAMLALHGCGDKDDGGSDSSDSSDGSNGSNGSNGSDGSDAGVPADEDCDDSSPTGGAVDPDDPDCDGMPTHAGGGDLVRVPAMSYEMGCTAGQVACMDDEYPVMPVPLPRNFYLGITEVTRGEYLSITGQRPLSHAGWGLGRRPQPAEGRQTERAVSCRSREPDRISGRAHRSLSPA